MPRSMPKSSTSHTPAKSRTAPFQKRAWCMARIGVVAYRWPGQVQSADKKAKARTDFRQRSDREICHNATWTIYFWPWGRRLGGECYPEGSGLGP